MKIRIHLINSKNLYKSRRKFKLYPFSYLISVVFKHYYFIIEYFYYSKIYFQCQRTYAVASIISNYVAGQFLLNLKRADYLLVDREFLCIYEKFEDTKVIWLVIGSTWFYLTQNYVSPIFSATTEISRSSTLHF